MTQEQLIAFLKENLCLNTETKNVYTGSCDGEMYKDETTIELVLCGEVISRAST